MQETAENSNKLKSSLPKDTQVKQENIKIHGIGLIKQDGVHTITHSLT